MNSTLRLPLRWIFAKRLLLRRHLDLRALLDQLLHFLPLRRQRALVAPCSRGVGELSPGQDEWIRDRHSGRCRHGALQRRKQRKRDETPAGAEGSPVDGEDTLPVELFV